METLPFHQVKGHKYVLLINYLPLVKNDYRCLNFSDGLCVCFFLYIYIYIYMGVSVGVMVRKLG